VRAFFRSPKGRPQMALRPGFSSIHPGPDGKAVVVLTIKGGPSIAVELDPENGGHLCQQLNTVLRDWSTKRDGPLVTLAFLWDLHPPVANVR
jgi:hypothetical protein